MVYKYNKKNSRENAKRFIRAVSPLRQRMVIEGRAALDNVKHATILDKIHDLFIDRKAQEDALSKKECSLILYPDETEKDPVTGETVPTGKALIKTTNMFHAFRKWYENKTIVLFGDLIYNEEKKVNEWLFYRIPNLRDFKSAQKRLKEAGMGYEDSIQEAIRKLTLSKATIARLEYEHQERIRARLRRKEKRNG